MAIVGNFRSASDFSRALQRIALRIHETAGERGLLVLRKNLAATALKLVSDGFREQADPYGKKWAPLAASTVAGRRKGRKKKGPKILLDTGRLRASFAAKPKGIGFVIASKVDYASPHQFGATLKRRRGGILGRLSRSKAVGKIPQRAMLPLSKQGLGKLWSKAFEDTARLVLVKVQR